MMRSRAYVPRAQPHSREVLYSVAHVVLIIWNIDRLEHVMGMLPEPVQRSPDLQM